MAGFGGDPDAILPSPDGGPMDQDPEAPAVVSFGPKGKNVSPTANVRVTFSEDMRVETINGNTFFLRRRGAATAVPAAVTYNAAKKEAILNPTRRLRQGERYVAIVKGGAAGGVKDLAGNALPSDRAWSFGVRP